MNHSCSLHPSPPFQLCAASPSPVMNPIGSIYPTTILENGDSHAGGRPLAPFIHVAQLLILKAEQHVTIAGGDGALPAGWVRDVLSLIEQAEAELLRGQGNKHGASVIAINATRTPFLSTERNVIWNGHEGKVVLPKAVSGQLEELQDDIETILTMIDIQTPQLSCEDEQVVMASDLAYLEVPEAEKSIMNDLARHATDLYYAPQRSVGDGFVEDGLQKKLDILSGELQAIFNARCDESTDLDDATMMCIVSVNQKRTELLRNIERLVGECVKIRQRIFGM